MAPFRFSNRMIYAVEALLDIAYNSGGGMVQSGEIMRRLAIPKRYLEPTLQSLVHGRIIESVRGPRGGYKLTVPADAISLARVAECCTFPAEGKYGFLFAAGSQLAAMVVRPLFEQLGHEVASSMERITLGDLCRRADLKSVKKVTF